MNQTEVRQFPWYALSISFFVSCIVLFLFYSNTFLSLEYSIQDYFHPVLTQANSVVIVDIDAATKAPYPKGRIPRRILADLLLKLNTLHPRVVALSFPLHTVSTFGVKDDEALSQAFMKSTYPIVLSVGTLHASREERDNFFTVDAENPLPQFLSFLQIKKGHSAKLADQAGVIRTIPTTVVDRRKKTDDGLYRQLDFIDSLSSVVTQIAKLSFDSEKNNLSPVTQIRFTKPEIIKKISAQEIIKGNITFDASLENKIIFMGSTEQKLLRTPLGIRMSDVEVDASVVNMLVQHKSLHTLNQIISAFRILIATLLPVFLFWSISRKNKALIVNILVGLSYWIMYILFLQRGEIGYIFYMTVGWISTTIILYFDKNFSGQHKNLVNEESFDVVS